MTTGWQPVRRLARAAQRWLGRLHRREREDIAAESAGMAHLHAIRFLIGSEACSQLEMALHGESPAGAERAIADAMAIDPTMPRLTELRAWHELRRDRPGAALAILEREPVMTTRLKLLLALVRLRAGQRALAHLELHGWSRQPGCPTAALVLLSWLEAEAGRTDQARALLHRHAAAPSSAAALAQLMLSDLLAEMPVSAQQHATELAHRFGHHRPAADMLETLNMTQKIDPAAVPVEVVDELAGQLIERPQVIRTLVVAQLRQPRPARVELLRRALERVVEDLADPLPAISGICELSLLGGRHDEAQRWASRGLKRHPLAVDLALLLDRATDNGAGLDDPPLDVLQRIAAARPYFPDVQRALIRRFLRDGMTDQARRHLDAWLEHQPDHPLAEKTRMELAA